MEIYKYITHPYTGRKVKTRGPEGIRILKNYNELKGGAALVVGSISAIIIIGGLFAYNVYFSSSVDDPRKKEDQKDIQIISKIATDKESSKEDIIKSLEKSKTLYHYYP